MKPVDDTVYMAGRAIWKVRADGGKEFVMGDGVPVPALSVLDEFVPSSNGHAAPTPHLHEDLGEVPRVSQMSAQQLEQVIAQAGSVKGAAQLLGVVPSTLSRRRKELRTGSSKRQRHSGKESFTERYKTEIRRLRILGKKPKQIAEELDLGPKGAARVSTILYRMSKDDKTLKKALNRK